MAKINHCTCGQGCYSIIKSPKPGETAADVAPHLLEEWHPTKNGCRTMEMFPRASGYKPWWICEQGHEWEASVSNRVRLKSGCAKCSRKNTADSVRGKYRPVKLEASLRTRFPEIAEIWHPTKNEGITPETIGARSEQRMWFQCKLGHEWRTSVGGCVAHFIKNGGTIPCKECSLKNKSVPKSGRSLADVYPEVAKNFHPTKNAPMTAYDYRPHANAYVWWLCATGHETWALINSKVNGHDCAKCNPFNNSKIEAIFQEACINSIAFSSVDTETKRLNISWRNRAVMSVDIHGVTISDRKIAIEYDGSYYHEPTKHPTVPGRDLAKTNALLDAGYLVVRVRENKLPHLGISHPNLLQVSHCYRPEKIRLPENVQATMQLIEEWIALK